MIFKRELRNPQSYVVPNRLSLAEFPHSHWAAEDMTDWYNHSTSMVSIDSSISKHSIFTKLVFWNRRAPQEEVIMGWPRRPTCTLSKLAILRSTKTATASGSMKK